MSRQKWSSNEYDELVGDAPVNIYHVPSADFVLTLPLPIEGGGSLTRYMRSYFVRAASASEAAELVRVDGLLDDAVLVEVEPPRAMQESALPSWLYQHLERVPRSGVCWRSGRAFYPAAES